MPADDLGEKPRIGGVAVAPDAVHAGAAIHGDDEELVKIVESLAAWVRVRVRVRVRGCVWMMLLLSVCAAAAATATATITSITSTISIATAGRISWRQC
jgi:hypothetical protein